MADPEDVREAAAALIRKQRNRARRDWHELQRGGYDSLEELQQETEELNVPATWAGKIGGRRKVLPGMENVTKEDLPLSRKAVNTMIQNLAPEDKKSLKIDRYQQILEGEAEEEAIIGWVFRPGGGREVLIRKSQDARSRTLSTDSGNRSALVGGTRGTGHVRQHRKRKAHKK